MNKNTITDFLWGRVKRKIIYIMVFILAFFIVILIYNWSKVKEILIVFLNNLTSSILNWNWIQTEWREVNKIDLNSIKWLGKSSWEWLDLLFVPVILGSILGFMGLIARGIANRQEKTRRLQEKELAEERNLQESLKNYLNQISQLIFNQNFPNASQDKEAQAFIRAMTTVFLEENDEKRKTSVIKLLYESEIIKYILLSNLSQTNLSNVNLSSFDLQGICLQDVNLRGANLSRANLSGAKLIGADLSEANLKGANLSKADLSKANLSGADLRGVNLIEAKLNRTNLNDADLSMAFLFMADCNKASFLHSTLIQASLGKTNLFKANLSGADLHQAFLQGADLREANLTKANLSLAVLSEANLCKAILNKADLSRANLSLAQISQRQLDTTAKYDSAILYNIQRD